MNIIYLHGFKSSSRSIKGNLLRDYCAQHHPEIRVHLPDLNMHPKLALEEVSKLLNRLPDAVLAGSSMGGFYAHVLAQQHDLPAVLINPAMRPWILFRELFSAEQFPFKVTDEWSLDQAQLDYLASIAPASVQDTGKFLLLLQQGDEVLDYREAQRYYSSAVHRAMIMTDARGNHGMDDFAEKIPAALQFLSDSIQ